MQKAGLPEGAVRQSMQRDKFQEDDIVAFLEGRVVAAAMAPPVASIDSTKFEKYKKMKAILPENVIRHKMQIEGCTAAEIDAFFSQVNRKSNQVTESPPEGMTEKVLSIKPPHKLKPFYWEKIKTTEVTSTVFYKLPDFTIPDVFVGHLNELYVAKAPTSHAGKTCGKATDQAETTTKKLASIVDAKRVQTVLIVMSKLKLEPEDVMKVCMRCLQRKLYLWKLSTSDIFFRWWLS